MTYLNREFMFVTERTEVTEMEKMISSTICTSHLTLFTWVGCEAHKVKQQMHTKIIIKLWGNGLHVRRKYTWEIISEWFFKKQAPNMYKLDHIRSWWGLMAGFCDMSD